MNISSLVVISQQDKMNEVVQRLRDSDFCKLHTHEKEKAIITIEASDASEEMQKIRRVESIEGVLGAYIVYTYCEQELDQERDKLLRSPDYPEWLNDETIDAEKIPYNGTVKF